jgi:hypothetical protein
VPGIPALVALLSAQPMLPSIPSIVLGTLVTLGSKGISRAEPLANWSYLAERDRLPYDISEPNGATIINQTPHRGVAETSSAEPPLIAIPDQRSSRQCEAT